MKKLVTAIAVSIFSISTVTAASFFGDHTVATDSVLRTIPKEVIAEAREKFHIVYQHTSHGTHVSRGVFGLPGFKAGDDTLFAVTESGIPEEGKLNFRDNYVTRDARLLQNYGSQCPDLSRDETAFITQTRDYLNDTLNKDVNVVMWSWCNIANHDVSGNYIGGMDSLIAEFGPGGTNPRADTMPVHFIFFTGHANTGSNNGDGRPKNQADLIRAHCQENGYFVLDYYNIDAHDMDGNYWDDASDNGTSNQYGGSFYQDFQDGNSEGDAWFNNLERPGGSESSGSHTTQHITGNRKAFAFWWILARLTGWEDGDTPTVISNPKVGKSVTVEQSATTLTLNNVPDNSQLSITDIHGKKLWHSETSESTVEIPKNFTAGIYLMQVTSPYGVYSSTIRL